MNTSTKTWPALHYSKLRDTLLTVQLWSQIIGKVRLKNMPWLNHSWHVTLYISSTGITTGSIPYDDGIFQVDMNFKDHIVSITTSNGGDEVVKLFDRSVADFYQEFTQKLQALGIDATIYAVPNEVVPAIPFAADNEHKTYDKDQMYHFWQVLVKVNNVFTRFRASFTGKCSPVHLFWGSFDLAVTRFSGRRAPEYSGAVPNIPLSVMQEAYSHEVSSCGFWPGNDQYPQAAFYSYCYPSPEDFGKQDVLPAAAFFSPEMGEFLLPYDAVQQADDPEATLLEFLETTYRAAAKTAAWNRHELECDLTRFEQ